MPTWQIDPNGIRMEEILPRLHPLAGVIGLGLRLGNRRHWRDARLDVAGLLRDAQRQTGLEDWGRDETLAQALDLLAAPRQDRAALTPLGKAALREVLLGRLVARLRMQDYLARNPNVESVPIRRPLFIVGLPRTGTTFLQHLLSLAPGCRPMLAWYGDAAGTSLDPAHLADDPRAVRAARQIGQIQRLVPDLAAIHPVSAWEPDEDLPFLMNTLMTDVFGLFADCEPYSRWLRKQDMAAAYRHYRRQLQILQHRLPDAYWVLKSPAHLPHLASLLDAFPDACIVHLHRDPVMAVSSTLSLRYKCLGALNRLSRKHLPELLRFSLDTLRGNLAASMAARERIPASHCLDVLYDDLVAQPLDAVRRIHSHFGYGWDEAYEARLCREISVRQASRPVHRHSLASFGIDPAETEEAFGSYRRRYRIPPEEPSPR